MSSIFPNKVFIIFPYIAFALLAGCTTNKTAEYMKSVENGNKLDANNIYTDELKNPKSLDYEMYLLEKGKLAFLNSNHETSRSAFNTEEEVLNQRELGDNTLPKANITVGSILVNDNMIPYRARLFEVEMIYLYQIYNYLALGDMEGALVETRLEDFLLNEAEKARINVTYTEENYRSSEAEVLNNLGKNKDKIKTGALKNQIDLDEALIMEQSKDSQKNNPGYDDVTDTSLSEMTISGNGSADTGLDTGKVAKNDSPDTSRPQKTKDNKKNVKQAPLDQKNVYLSIIQDASDKQFRKMAGVLEKSKSSVLNPYVLYVSGLLHEMNGELEDAYISYKQGLDIMPENPYFQKEAMRLAVRLNKEIDFDQFQNVYPELWKAINASPNDPVDNGRLVIFFEEGWSPQKKQVLIDLGAFSIAYPVYDFKWIEPIPLTVSEGDTRLGSTFPVCYMGALALRALQEEAKWRIIRQVARATVKGAAFAAGVTATAVGSANNNSALQWIGIGMTTFFATYNRLSENADLRSWMTLPENAQVISVSIREGEHNLKLRQDKTALQLDVPVTIRKGQTTIILVINTGTRFMYERLWPNTPKIK